MRAALILAAGALFFGCTDDSFDVLVDLRTDYAPGVEFDRVLVALHEVDADGTRAATPLRSAETAARVGQDLVAGERVAELGGIPPGTYFVEMELFFGTRSVAVRTVVVEVEESRGLVVVITRACDGLLCPGAGSPANATTCIAGVCVDPRCVSGGDPECPATVCNAASDCPPPAAACAVATCAEGFCLYGAMAGACGASELCDPDVGCRPVGPPADGGMDGSTDGGVDAPADTPTGPWLTGYGRRRPIDFLAARVDSDQLAFPAFVGIAADSALAANARSDGADLVFTDADATTVLPFEIERFDSATGRLDAWVRLPELSSSADTRVYLYYDDPSAAPREDPAAVWDSDYVGVWHLAEAPGVDSAIIDSTGAADLTPTGAMPASARQEGKLGWALVFDGMDDRLSAPADPRFAVTNLTLSAWVRPRVWQPDVGLIAARSTMPGATNHDYFLRATSGDLNFGVYTEASDGVTWGEWTTADEWHLVVGTYDGTTQRIFFDGMEVGSDPSNGPIRDTMRPFNIGSWGIADPDRTWNGWIDEVRVSRIARSPGWLATRHANESDPSSFHLIGAEEPP